MPASNDKFIFVNAPTIINAGPRDARRQLRSQLMRRVYLRKYKVSPPQIPDIVDTIEQLPPKEEPESDCSSRDTTTSPPMAVQQLTPPGSTVSTIESKLPTPPSEGDSDDGCCSCGGFCRSPDQCQPIVPAHKKVKLEKESPMDLDPFLSLAVSHLNSFALPDGAAKAPNINMLLDHCKLETLYIVTFH